jgi:hypothetical protein
MSQSRFLQEEYSKKDRQAANNAAINLAITDLVAARNLLPIVHYLFIV